MNARVGSARARRRLKLDRILAPTGGEAAAVVIVAGANGVHGACVGDVEAVLLTSGDTIDLTKGRRRKPLLGSGNADPVAFTSKEVGRLLIATDGLWGYAKRDALLGALRDGPLETLPERLVAHVRLRSGDLQDDVGLVVCDLAS